MSMQETIKAAADIIKNEEKQVQQFLHVILDGIIKSMEKEIAQAKEVVREMASKEAPAGGGVEPSAPAENAAPKPSDK